MLLMELPGKAAFISELCFLWRRQLKKSWFGFLRVEKEERWRWAAL